MADATVKDIKKILIIQLRPYGDVLLATSYLEALRNSFPESRIDFLVSAPYDDILYKNPFVSNVIVSPKKGGISYYTGRLAIIIKAVMRRYDVIIDQADAVGSRPFLLLCGARYRIGWETGKSPSLYNMKAPADTTFLYAALRNCDMVLPLGIRARPKKMYYHVRPESLDYIDNWLSQNRIQAKRFICVSPGSPELYKRWDTGSFVQTARLLAHDLGVPVVISGLPAELADFKAGMGDPPEGAAYGPLTTFNQLAALLTRSRLLICNDGGVNHLSVATETPALALFGPSFVAHWSAQGAFPHHYHLHNPQRTALDGQTFGITPAMVVEKVRQMLAELHP